MLNPLPAMMCPLTSKRCCLCSAEHSCCLWQCGCLLPVTCFPPVPATGKPLSMESPLSAGTSDHLIQLLAHHHQQEQQPTMMQGSPGPVPAQLLALLVQQQRLQQLGQTPQHQLGTAAAAGGRIMDTSAQKSQEDLALERLAAQLEQCRKTTAQQAGAAK